LIGELKEISFYFGLFLSFEGKKGLISELNFVIM